MSNENNPLIAFSKALAEAAEKGGQSTVLVNGRRRLPSSGVAYAADLILTANHAVERDEEIQVLLPDGKEIAAEVIGRDHSSDLAVLRLSEAGATVAEVVAGDVRVGELVLALGRPSRGGIEASLGVVSAVSGPVRTRRGGMIGSFIRTDAIPLPGFSGGPLVNADGLVIGVSTSGLAHGMLLTIPTDVAWRTAKELVEHGSIKHGYIGIRSQEVEIPQAARSALGRQQDTGLLVVFIEEESSASESDLMVGDIIVGIAGTQVSDHDSLVSQLVGDLVGKTTQIEVLRGGQLETIEVTIAERERRTHQGYRRHGRHSGHHHHRHPHSR
jgi:S1-C subfamily serine protease